MQVKYIGKSQMNYIIENNDIDLTPGKIYTATIEGKNDYRIVDDSGEDYLYPQSWFEVIS